MRQFQTTFGQNLSNIIGNPEKVNEQVSKLLQGKIVSTVACLHTWGISQSSNPDRDICILAMPQSIYYKKLLDEFNAKFNNISVDVLDEQPLYFKRNVKHTSRSSWGKTQRYYFYSLSDKNDFDVYCYLVTFKFQVSKEYDYKTHVIYLVHHLFQTINPCMDWFKIYRKLPDKNVIRFVINKVVNRLNDTWRALSNAKLNPGTFFLLDDIEHVNKCFKKCYKRESQTELLLSLVKEK